ncbi:MAG: hypothetical protein ACYST9_04860 [Planctomycetota bacterium]
MAASCLALAQLLGGQLQQRDEASKYYKKGLELCLSEDDGVFDTGKITG